MLSHAAGEAAFMRSKVPNTELNYWQAVRRIY